MGHRRYLPIEKHPIYSEFFDFYKLNSVVMNAHSRSHSFSHAGDYNDPQFLKGLILEWEGDGEGQFYELNSGDTCQARIPRLKEKLKNIEEEFRQFQQQRINSGYGKPNRMPKEMDERRLETEAKLDICLEELDYLKDCLIKVEKNRQEQKAKKVLYRGPEGSGSLREGLLVKVDGQAVKPTKDGILIIDDERSPFDGMATADYFSRIVQPWKKVKSRLNREKRKLTQKLAAKGMREEVNEEWNGIRKKLFKAYPHWGDLFTVKIEGKPAMPAWPKDVTNHKKE